MFIACGPTHTAVTPLDLVKCRRQVDSKLYTSNVGAWKSIYSKEGLRGVFFGWAPTYVGYSLQGAGKYGFYEVFKYYYGERLFPNAPQTVVYLGASASAEFLADMALCPFEAIKVRMQTTLPPFASTLREGWAKVVKQEGYAGLYKGLYPLWARQIPYTMVKFATFESAVNAIYAQLGKPKESFNGLQQTGVSFLGGYIAGIGCAVISHPADVMVSKLNADRKAGESAGQAIGRIYKQIGFGGLWNGLGVRIGMIGTLTAFQWLIYDSFKVYLGVSAVRVEVLESEMLTAVLAPNDWWTLSDALSGEIEQDTTARIEEVYFQIMYTTTGRSCGIVTVQSASISMFPFFIMVSRPRSLDSSGVTFETCEVTTLRSQPYSLWSNNIRPGKVVEHGSECTIRSGTWSGRSGSPVVDRTTTSASTPC